MYSPKSVYCSYAFDIICSYIRSGKKPSIDKYLEIKEFKIKRGCFVSIHKNGELRGCIGTITPYRESLLYEIMENAVAAAERDPRFMPLSEAELAQIDISVDILSEPEKISSFEELNHIKYGVIVSRGLRKGVLLPNLEGVDSWEEQLMIAKSKAGLSEFNNSEIEIYRFSSERYY